MFRRVLVANRGEIAVRIVRTLRALGIESVVVHHASEAEGLAARSADVAVPIDGEPPVAAYLDALRIVEAARRTGADAVHPGYGFLSENAGFAEAVTAAGLAWIGPSAETIRLMGDKLAARAFAAGHGAPVLPSATDHGDAARFAGEAAALGLPLLVKAAAGGGGKGMTVVREARDLAPALALARGEAERYFADGRLYAERLVERPRHVEVQVLGDAHGNLVHLGERDCSVQRRFQKIVEETPAPGLPDDLRAAICDSAVNVAKAAGYVAAGTVEFVLEPDGRFWFLEMNTRLQVEHPVTELVTGLDLVAEQLRIAAGESLGYGQDDVQASGHAIECRIYAEDAEAGFLPDTGRVLLLHEPAGPGVRVDSGIAERQPVTADFDPILMKLAAHGRDRAAAIARLRAGLAELVLLGVTTNADYLQRLLGHDAFAAGQLHTGFVEQHAEALRSEAVDEETVAAVLAAAMLGRPGLRAAVDGMPEPWASMGSWRN